MKKYSHHIKTNQSLIYFFYFIVLVASLSISYILFLHQQSVSLSFGPFKGDAGNYIAISHDLKHYMTEGIRTYGYPLFLKLIRFPYPESKIFSFYILVVQYLIYAISVFAFAFSVIKSQNIRLLVIIGLLLNINILSFLSVTLTETLSISILLLNCAIFFGIKKGILRVFLLGLFSAFAVEIRPANLWVYVFIIVLLLLEFTDKNFLKRKALKLFPFFILGSIISFAPQIYFNYIYFHKITPLPGGDLAKLQFQLAKKIAFIAFSLEPSSFTPHGFASQVQNPFILASSHHFKWLSVNGLSYAVFKILIMFQHTDLFVYEFLRETYQKILILFSSFNTYFGIFGLTLQYKYIPFEKRRAIFIGLGLCVLLHLFTQLEDRFTFAICLLLMPFAIYQFYQFITDRKYKLLICFIFFFLFANLFNSILESLSINYVAAIQAGVLK